MRNHWVLVGSLVAVATGACGGQGDHDVSAAPEAASSTTQALAKKDDSGAILPQLGAATNVSGSTVPDNGDVNPYGVAFVPRDFPKGGILNPGDVLVANFNNSDNLQ